MRAELNTIEIPLSTVFTRISAAALINPPMRRLFEGGAYLSNWNWQLKSLLHLGPFITLRPSAWSFILVHNSFFFLQNSRFKKLFVIRFSYKYCNLTSSCLPVKMASKTVMNKVYCGQCENSELYVPLMLPAQLMHPL